MQLSQLCFYSRGHNSRNSSRVRVLTQSQGTMLSGTVKYTWPLNPKRQDVVLTPTLRVKSTGLEKTGTLPSQAAHAQPPLLSVPVANAQAGSHPRGSSKGHSDAQGFTVHTSEAAVKFSLGALQPGLANLDGLVKSRPSLGINKPFPSVPLVPTGLHSPQNIPASEGRPPVPGLLHPTSFRQSSVGKRVSPFRCHF